MSLDEFIYLTRRIGGREITAQNWLRKIEDEKTGELFRECTMHFTSGAQLGHEIVIYTETYRDSDIGEQTSLAKAFITSEERLRVIKQRLPEVNKIFYSPGITKEKREELKKFAKEYGLKPYPKS